MYNTPSFLFSKHNLLLWIDSVTSPQGALLPITMNSVKHSYIEGVIGAVI